MIIISRKLNEALQVGNVRIVAVAISRDKVKLGFECDASIPIWRSELAEKIAAGGQPIMSHAKLHRAVRKSQEHLRDGGGE